MPDSPRALIFNVQRFSLHDGPGIRTTVFFKGCPLRCRWCQNPESFRREPEIAFAADRCRGTGECLAACPRDALRQGEGRVVRENCDACGLCVPACAYGALHIIGRSIPVDELLEQVSRDLPFYRASGGGVTLSGGEPTLQMEFVGAFARDCREHGISVGLQTCGLFRWEDFEPFRREFDFIHFDLKAIDPARHRDLTGGDNRPILHNARRLVSTGAPVIFRSLVVPGLTDDETNLKGIAAFLQELGVSSLRLLRYHAMGEAKLPRIGRPMPPLGIRDGEGSFTRATEILRREGILS